MTASTVRPARLPDLEKRLARPSAFSTVEKRRWQIHRLTTSRQPLGKPTSAADPVAGACSPTRPRRTAICCGSACCQRATAARPARRSSAAQLAGGAHMAHLHRRGMRGGHMPRRRYALPVRGMGTSGVGVFRKSSKIATAKCSPRLAASDGWMDGRISTRTHGKSTRSAIISAPTWQPRLRHTLRPSCVPSRHRPHLAPRRRPRPSGRAPRCHG